MDIENKSLRIVLENIRAEERERCAKLADREGRYQGCGCPCCASRAASFDDLATEIRNLK